MHFQELQRGRGEPVPLRSVQGTLEGDRRELLERFDVVDVARKVVGVGSVGTRCFIVLLLGRDSDDPLFLQIKEAGPSVLEPYLGRSRFIASRPSGRRRAAPHAGHQRHLPGLDDQQAGQAATTTGASCAT